jgi:hypothetical protein
VRAADPDGRHRGRSDFLLRNLAINAVSLNVDGGTLLG